MPDTRWIHFRIDEALYERMRAEAAADRRSLANWLSVTIERLLAETPSDSEQSAS